jgi:multisubunit Na+/H+ antiporter MnhC subunit
VLTGDAARPIPHAISWTAIVATSLPIFAVTGFAIQLTRRQRARSGVV